MCFCGGCLSVSVCGGCLSVCVGGMFQCIGVCACLSVRLCGCLSVLVCVGGRVGVSSYLEEMGCTL